MRGPGHTLLQTGPSRVCNQAKSPGCSRGLRLGGALRAGGGLRHRGYPRIQKLYKKEPEQRKTKPEHTTDIQQQTTSERALSTDSSCLICYVPSIRLIPYYYRAGGLQCHIGTGPTPNRPHTDLSTHRADRPESEYITNNCKSYGKSFRDVAGKVPRNTKITVINPNIRVVIAKNMLPFA